MKNLSTVLSFFVLASTWAQQPTPPSITLAPIYSGASTPVGIYSAGDDRLFILEQSQGDIEIITTAGVHLGKFLDVTGLISTGGERGLLGLAFHPDYDVNGYFYINYTNLTGNTVVARYEVSNNPNVANPLSGEILLTITQPYGNHNGGNLAFGPDGFLYIGMGDGGGQNDPQNYSQNPMSMLGKMLRIDVDGQAPYAIPDDNPFVGQSGILPEIWARGLRNPWKYTFDALTGDLWIGDVGQNAWEEVDLELAGSSGGMNWGWRCYEGNNPNQTAGCQSASAYDFPVAVYSHADPFGFCSVTGGYVYRGSHFPGLYGHYLLCDYCSGDFYSLYPDGNGGFNNYTLLTTSLAGFTAFGQDWENELYVARNNGTIYRIDENCGAYLPVITSDGNGGLICDGPADVWWWKDGSLMNDASGSAYTPLTSGAYYATADNGSGCIRQSNTIQWLINSGIAGCTYPEAINFNPDAEADDGSCQFGLEGCTYPSAVNYNPSAVRDDGSCDFGPEGCTYPLALNYDPAAVRDNGSCIFGIPGCTYPQAANYDPAAQRDDGSCLFPDNANCPVDLNGDGLVNTGDLFLFIASWGLVCD